MVTYEYTGEGELVFPTIPVTVNKGDQFEAPAGLIADGLKVVGQKDSAPAVSEAQKIKETPKQTTQPSAPSDTSAGA
jgi:hypothetical protein